MNWALGFGLWALGFEKSIVDQISEKPVAPCGRVNLI
jgi:hypothetical protein